MVTRNKFGANVQVPTSELVGLSTDEKPIGNYNGSALANGSTFVEIDTLDIYVYDAENKVWKAPTIDGGPQTYTASQIDSMINNILKSQFEIVENE